MYFRLFIAVIAEIASLGRAAPTNSTCLSKNFYPELCGQVTAGASEARRRPQAPRMDMMGHLDCVRMASARSFPSFRVAVDPQLRPAAHQNSSLLAVPTPCDDAGVGWTRRTP